jgi:hypothetical protein
MRARAVKDSLKKINTPVPMEQSSPRVASKGVSFSEKTYAFGDIHEGDKVVHTFRMYNNTGKAVSINDVKVSCGCTAADYTFEPIATGGNTDIKVTFDSKGKFGVQKKTATVQTSAGSYEISMTGMVYDK